MDKNKVDLIAPRAPKPHFQMVLFRVIKIVKKLFDAELKYKSFPIKGVTNQTILITLLKKNNPLILIDKAVFPVYLNGLIIGIAEVKSVKQLNKSQLSKLKDLVGLLCLEEQESDKLGVLKRIENQFALTSANQSDNSNVLMLSKYRTPERTIPPKFNFISENSSPILDFSSIITARSYDDILKLAHELHYYSKRYAFLRFDDLDIEHNKIDELSSIGPVSLFIPEIKELTQPQLQIVKYLLTQHESPDTPKVIIGTVDDRATFIQNLGMQIFNDIAYFNMENSFEDYKESGLFNFLTTEMKAHRLQ